uniref:Phosphoglycerate mutase n=1 Tax=Moniliophthora roreri TaxID=221103 RepID=A0A0W0GCJ5_MONRR
MLTVTFIRHGESLDNLRSIWAGWKDAPLSDLGRKQAAAAGRYFSTTPFKAIYASPLLRAHATAQAVRDANTATPDLPVTANPKLREQHFGVAEGNKWAIDLPERYSSSEEAFKDKVYPVLYERHEKFPEGETLDDLARRSEEAIAECVLPHMKAGEEGHIILASHGLAISELVAALLRLDPDADKNVDYRGLVNTGWTRAVVQAKDLSTTPPILSVQITDVNIHEHLKNLDTTSVDAEHDPDQAEKQAFFGGGGQASAAAEGAKM